VGGTGVEVGVVRDEVGSGVNGGPEVSGISVDEIGVEGKGVGVSCPETAEAGVAAVDVPVGRIGWGRLQALSTQASSRKGRILR